MGSSEKYRFLSWLKEKGDLQSVLTIPNVADGIRSVIDAKEQFIYDNRSNSAKLCVQVQGTQYEGRGPRIESIQKGNPLKLRREPDNAFNANNIAVQNKAGKSLGNLPADLANVLSPLLDSGEAELHNIQASHVEPLSKRSAKAKRALLYVSFTVKLKKTDYSKLAGCTLCLLGGDQGGGDSLRRLQALTGNAFHSTWVQELQVLHCKMPVEQAKLIFELYNRYHREYDDENNETGYFGLDNLEEEVACAREKMRKEKLPGLSYDAPKDEKISLLDFAQEQIQKEPQRYDAVKSGSTVATIQRWERLLAEHNITQSMSRKGNCMDNGAMENFFGRLKVEMFYGEQFESVEDFIHALDDYIYYYNNERISLKLKGMSPVQYRTHSQAS